MREDYRYLMQAEHCYLRREKGEEDGLELAMLLQNTVKGLLTCRQEQRNGESFLLFDVTSKKTLSDLFEGLSLQERDIRALVEEIIHIVRECDRYMLDRSRLILDAERIFCNQDGSKFFFLYDPYVVQNGNENLKNLADFLIARVNYDDESAIDLANRVYSAIRSPNFTMRTLQECLEYRTPDCEGEEEKEEDLKAEDSADMHMTAVSGFQVKALLSVLILAIGFTVVVLAAILLVCFRLTWKEQMLVTLAAIAGLLAVILCILNILRQRRRLPEEPEPVETAKQMDEKTVLVSAGEYSEGRGLQGIGCHRQLWIPFPRLPYTLGKREGFVDYCLEEPTVSRIHARFFMEGDKIYLTDLHSTNGTYVNGMRLEPEQKLAIRPGDQISFGKAGFIYC